MTTKGDFVFSKDKRQSIANNFSNTDKSDQCSNLNLNQNCSFLIPVQYSNNPKNYNYHDAQVSDKYNKSAKSEAWNKSTDYCLHTLILNDKSEEANKKWKKDGLSDANNITLSLHINAYENTKEITELDKLDGENFELKRNKVIMHKQLFPRLMIRNPFEFPRQQEEDHVTEPEVTGFRASQRLLGSNQSISSNTVRIPTAVVGSHVANTNLGCPMIRFIRPNLVSSQVQQQHFFRHPPDLGLSVG
uniref:Uncharacterized protein n=1 Tax=Panagrolaimus davidi TaxID=227884 RepID=A0A914PTP4_9BILA